jgi:hypothetical protein
MGLVVPDTLETETLNNVLGSPLTLKLYSNNKVPAGGDNAAAYTEVAGGGYASKPLTLANWNIVAGAPSAATYNALQQWTFSGPTNAPGTIYGYFVTRNSDGKLMWAERFPAGSLPFSPIAGSNIRILPKFTVGSQF